MGTITLASVRAEQADVESKLKAAARAGDASALRDLQRRRDELPGELAIAKVNAIREELRTLDQQIANTKVTLQDPERPGRAAALLEAAEQAKAAAVAAELAWRCVADQGWLASNTLASFDARRRDIEARLEDAITALAGGAS